MDQLFHVLSEIREKCPWHKHQTSQSLAQYIIEEAYELDDAIRKQDPDEICNELGDVLLQVIYQSLLFSERGLFNFSDVVQLLTEKLMRRHPHVFQKNKSSYSDLVDIRQMWVAIKEQENQGGTASRLDQIKHGPAMSQAQEIQEKAAQLGFDFEGVSSAYNKLDEELRELREAIEIGNPDQVNEEFGDCLFSLINVGRKLGISSESALLATILKFRKRFSYIESQAALQGKHIEKMSLQEMDQLWEKAKEIEN